MITSLASSNIPDMQIMQLSGHKNVQSLNSYEQASLQQQQEMSHILSSLWGGIEASPCKTTKQLETPSSSRYTATRIGLSYQQPKAILSLPN